MDLDMLLVDKNISTYYAELLSLATQERPKPTDLLLGRDGVVLIGAGNIGQQFLTGLHRHHIPVLALTDNNPAKWGSTIDGLTILPPAQSALMFGDKSLFIVTIGRIASGVDEVKNQFFGLGASTCLHFTEAIRFLPQVWDHFFLRPDTFSANDIDEIVTVYGMLGDEKSREIFMSHLKWRVIMDARALEIPEWSNQYFPSDLIKPSVCATFVDIGAYSGDTLEAVKNFAGDNLRAYYGFEPDPLTYQLLATKAERLSESSQARIETQCIAVGSCDGPIGFTGEAQVTSHISIEGKYTVQCRTLDSLKILQPSYVKIDVEGFENQVLQGGKFTIETWNPTIAIASYHHPKDIFKIPLQIRAINPNYHFYFRSHGEAGVDLVCYAICN